jgi:hypothetical protein
MAIEGVTPGTPGRCYECFNDLQCADNEDKKYCAPAGSPNQFSCVECNTAAHCEAESNEENNETPIFVHR